MRSISYLPVNVIHNFGIIFFSSLCIKIASSFITPIALASLDPSSCGIWSLLSSSSAFATIIFGLGLRQAYMLTYAHYELQEQRHMMADIITLYVLWITIIFVCFGISYPYWSQYLSYSCSLFMILGTILSSCLFFFNELFFQYLKNQQDMKRLSRIQTVSSLITLISTLIFLLYCKLGVIGLVVVQLLYSISITIIACNEFIPHLHYSFKRAIKRIAILAPLSLPFVPSILCNWLISSSDRWFLAHYCSIEEVGTYGFAYLITIFFNTVLLVPLGSSYIPHILQSFAQRKQQIHSIEKNNRSLMTRCMIVLGICIIGGSWILKPFFYFMVPSHYHAAYESMVLLAVGQLFLCGTYFTTILAHYAQRSYFLAFSLALPACMNLGLNYILIPHLGCQGAALASTSSYMIYFCITLWHNAQLANAYK